MNIYVEMSHNEHFTNKSMIVNGKNILIKDVLDLRFQLAVDAGHGSTSLITFDKIFNLEQAYQIHLKNQYKLGAIPFFESELGRIDNLKRATNNPIVLKILEDQITVYCEALVDLNKES